MEAVESLVDKKDQDKDSTAIQEMVAISKGTLFHSVVCGFRSS